MKLIFVISITMEDALKRVNSNEITINLIIAIHTNLVTTNTRNLQRPE